MKIALCFYGQPRFYKNQEIVDFLRDIRAEDVEVDVYMHIWKPSEKDYTRSPHSGIDLHLAVIDDYQNLEERVKETYSPAALVIEDERKLCETDDLFQEIARRRFYSQKKVSDLLKESGKNYDLVFKMRTDSAVRGILPLKELNDKYIWVPDNVSSPYFYNEDFSISSQENFYKSTDTYSNLKEFGARGAAHFGETMFKAQLEKEGLTKNARRNRFINVGLVKGERPKRLTGVWINEEFHQAIELQE